MMKIEKLYPSVIYFLCQMQFLKLFVIADEIDKLIYRCLTH